jgi:hypothetical protein
MTTPETTATTATRQDIANLELLLQRLATSGWVPGDVLFGLSSEEETNYKVFIEQLKNSTVPLLRMVKDGHKRALITLQWGHPYQQLVKKSCGSHGIYLKIKEAVEDPDQAVVSQPGKVKDVIAVRGISQCRCSNDDCDCPAYDSLAFTINGMHGYGSGQWVQDSPTGRPYFDCTFMGWSFKASSPREAKEKIRSHFKAFKTIQFSEL